MERGWIAREEAAARIAVTLRFFWNSPQGEQADATGYKGFYGVEEEDCSSGEDLVEQAVQVLMEERFRTGCKPEQVVKITQPGSLIPQLISRKKISLIKGERSATPW